MLLAFQDAQLEAVCACSLSQVGCESGSCWQPWQCVISSVRAVPLFHPPRWQIWTPAAESFPWGCSWACQCTLMRNSCTWVTLRLSLCPHHREWVLPGEARQDKSFHRNSISDPRSFPGNKISILFPIISTFDKSLAMFYMLKCIQGAFSHISNFRVSLKYFCYQI